MTRKVMTQPIKRLNIELPLAEFEQLEIYCQQHQQTKKSVIRSLIQQLTISQN